MNRLTKFAIPTANNINKTGIKNRPCPSMWLFIRPLRYNSLNVSIFTTRDLPVCYRAALWKISNEKCSIYLLLYLASLIYEFVSRVWPAAFRKMESSIQQIWLVTNTVFLLFIAIFFKMLDLA